MVYCTLQSRKDEHPFTLICTHSSVSMTCDWGNDTSVLVLSIMDGIWFCVCVCVSFSLSERRCCAGMLCQRSKVIHTLMKLKHAALSVETQNPQTPTFGPVFALTPETDLLVNPPTVRSQSQTPLCCDISWKLLNFIHSHFSGTPHWLSCRVILVFFVTSFVWVKVNRLSFDRIINGGISSSFFPSEGGCMCVNVNWTPGSLCQFFPVLIRPGFSRVNLSSVSLCYPVSMYPVSPCVNLPLPCSFWACACSVWVCMQRWSVRRTGP